MLDIDRLARLARQAYVSQVIAAFGERGGQAITELLDAVRLIFQKATPEALPCVLTVLRGIDDGGAPSKLSSLGNCSSMGGHDQLGRAIMALSEQKFAFVEIISDGSFELLVLDQDLDLPLLATDSVVYRYQHRRDRILAKALDEVVIKASPLLASAFASPTFNDLEQAFERYSSEAKDSSCVLLGSAWEGGADGPRLVLVNKPERIMRDSLVQALRYLLPADATVRPEQNTDTTKPVDIRVDWFASSTSAIIEIKWLGKSTAISRKPKPEPTYTEYDASRAQDGAQQLADYLEREVRNTSANALKGYLVVFDGRRSGTKGANDALSAEDALAYEHEEIALDPDPSASRRDFAPPVRFYLRPRETHFALAA